MRTLTHRWLGVPWLFAVSYSAVGFSIYFSVGLVADRGLALTPLIFLGVGVVFMLNAMTYVEGAAMFPERGGSSTLGRHAFNELIAFIAGWAILIDYLIVIALAAISVPHYLTPISASFGEGTAELITAGVVIAAAAAMNIVGFSGGGRQLLLTLVAIGGVLLLVAVVVVGAITSFDASALTAELDLFTSPSVEDVLYAGVIATVAYAGIEAASSRVPGDRPQAPRRGGRRRGADPLHGRGRNRGDGGAGRPHPRRAGDGTRDDLPRGADPGRGHELRAGLGGRRHASGRGRRGAACPGLGGEHFDARALAAHLRARH
jgi:hypothetical protein